MTQQRRDDNGTEFGDWTRNQPEIDSSLGYIATNIDWMWHNYETAQWMLIEEKRNGYFPKWYQIQLYMLLNQSIDNENYCGFHMLIFENTNPDDGGIYLDGKWIGRSDLIEFLQFNKPEEWYMSWFPPKGYYRIGSPPEIAYALKILDQTVSRNPPRPEDGAAGRPSISPDN